jgi:hypothetical protein
MLRLLFTLPETFPNDPPVVELPVALHMRRLTRTSVRFSPSSSRFREQLIVTMLHNKCQDDDVNCRHCCDDVVVESDALLLTLFAVVAACCSEFEIISILSK